MMEFNRRKRGRSEWRRALVIVALCLLLALGGSFFNRSLGRVVLVVASPFVRFSNHLATTIRDASSALRDKQKLLIENNQLKQRLVEVEALVINHQVLEADNRLLRQEIGLAQNQPSLVLAEILSHPWNAPFDVILVTVPAASQFAVGNQVTFKGQVLAGEVLSRAGTTAKVKLISAPGSEIPVLIGPNNVPALASGKGSGNLEVRLPRNLEIRLGDLVTAGSATGPLVIGTVGAVENESAESLQTILIRTPINLSFVRYLEINGQ